MWRGQEHRILSPDDLHRRASGRRHYNSVRQFQATYRRVQVARLLAQGRRQATIARLLGVHRSTINRDVVAIIALAGERGACPTCGRPYASSWPI